MACHVCNAHSWLRWVEGTGDDDSSDVVDGDHVDGVVDIGSA